MSNYDPFNDLQPPKNLIKDCIKAFKLQASALLEDIRVLRQNPLADWLVEQKQHDHKQLIHKISRYQMYVDGVDLSNDRETMLQEAKKRPITDFYPGKLRKLGPKLIGKCPFHQDDSPSFVVYPNNTFHCFGCGANGDVLDFVGKTQNLDFNATLKLLS